MKEQLKKYVGGIVTEETTDVEISESDRSTLEEYVKLSIEMIVGMDDDQAEEIVHPSSILNTCEESMVASVRSWMNVKEELEKYKKILSYDIDVNRENIEINVICEFDNGESNVKIVLARKDLSLVVIEFEHIQ